MLAWGPPMTMEAPKKGSFNGKKHLQMWDLQIFVFLNGISMVETKFFGGCKNDVHPSWVALGSIPQVSGL